MTTINTVSIDAHFNRKALFEKMYKQDELVNEILGLGKADLNENLLLLNEYFSTNNTQEVANIAHKLKGTAASIGFGVLLKLLNELEELALQNKLNSNILEKITFEIEFLHTNVFNNV